MRLRGIDWLFITILLFFAVCLRLIAIDFGQPDAQYAQSTVPMQMLHDQTPLHPDEFLFITRPFRMLLTGHPNPQFFENPLFLINTNFVSFWLTDAGNGLTHDERLTGNFRNYAPFHLYVIGRVYSALGGILAVAGAYAATRLIAGRYAALLAGLLSAVALTLVQHAHYSTTSSLSAGFVMLCIWASFAALRAKLARNQWILFVLAGICAGLAGGNRYNAAAVSLIVFFAGWILLFRHFSRQTTALVLIGWMAFPVTFLFTTIQLLFDFDGFLRDFRSISTQYLSGLDRINSVSPLTGLWLEYQYLFLMVLGIPALILCLWSLYALFQPKKRLYVILLLTLIIPYSFVILRTVRPNGADQLLIPVIPVFAMLTGIGFAGLVTWLDRQSGYLAPIIIVFVVCMPLIFTVQFLWVLNQLDTREHLQVWVYEHLPRNSRIHLVGPYNVPLDAADYDVSQSFSNFESAEELRAMDVDYLIVSGALFHPAQGANADYLVGIHTVQDSWQVAGFRQIAAVNSPNWWIVGYRGLHTPSYWHDPDLTVYCMNPIICEVLR